MTIERQRRIFAILRSVLDSSAPTSAAQLIELCGGDETLAADVSALLHERAPNLLDGSSIDVASRLLDASHAPQITPGTSIGGWTIRHEIGRGGMGTVFLAERTGDGYVQQGALKLIKRGMDSDDVLARFRAERRILAGLVHPNIARLLDGGVSAEGRPYFVMEHVEGNTLQRWVAQTQAGLDARVAVFQQICEAVAHAHHNLVVHRDIKPENVLVDAGGHARLLDFGIAKLLEVDDGSDRTATQRRFVSHAYAAPEQVSGAAATTATDIYQLGVLLFELLTGARFDAAPSGAVSGWLVRAQAQSSAASQQVIAAADLRGDPGIIVARATNMEASRRYATVEALASDVHAWRSQRPITARADSSAYRLQRFIGRHRIATALAALAVAAVLAGSTLALWQARKAATEARLARSAQAFLTSVFDAAAPDAAAGERVTARELLDRGSERIGHELADQPRLRGEMLLTLGALYRQLGQYPQAEHLLDDARTTLIATAPGSESATRAAIELAVVARELGKLDDAERGFAAALASAETPELRSRATAEQALLREKQGHFDIALADARAAAALDAARGASGRGDHARDRHIEGLMLERLGKFDEAMIVFQEAIADTEAAYGSDDTRVAQVHGDYALALLGRGRAKEAEVELRKALDIRRRRLGNDHPAVAESEQVLGSALRLQGRNDEALAAFESALAIQRHAFGDKHALVANTLNSIGLLAIVRRDWDSAERTLREATTILRELGQDKTPPAATTSNNWGSALMQLGRYEEAEPLMRDALALHLSILGDSHPAVLSDSHGLALLALRRRQPSEAETHARRAAKIADAVLGKGRDVASVHITLARAVLANGHATEAMEQTEVAERLLKDADAMSDMRHALALSTRADALVALGRFDEAQQVGIDVLREREARSPTDVPELVASHALLARIAHARGREDERVRERSKARTLLATIAKPDPWLAQDIAAE